MTQALAPTSKGLLFEMKKSTDLIEIRRFLGWEMGFEPTIFSATN